MSHFSKSEKKSMKDMSHTEHSLAKEVKREKRTLLSRIKYVSSKKIMVGLLLTMSFLAKYNTAQADTNKVKQKLKHFHGWFMKNEQKITDNTISYNDVISHFEDALRNLEQEVRDDINNHNFEKAQQNLDFFYKLAKSLGDKEMMKTISYLIREVETEQVAKNKGYGIYNVNEKIYVILEEHSSDRGIAEKEALSDARMMAVRKLAEIKGGRTDLVKGNVYGSYIVKIYKIGANTYKFIISINMVDDAESTRLLLTQIQKTSIK